MSGEIVVFIQSGEKLLFSPPLWKVAQPKNMTGISDVFKNSQELIKYSKQTYYGFADDLADTPPPQPQCPDPRPSMALIEKKDCKKRRTQKTPSKSIADYKWAILCPVTSRRSLSSGACLDQLKNSARSIVESVPKKARRSTKIYFGFDLKDPLYDPKFPKNKCEEEKKQKKEIRQTVRKFFKGIKVEFVPFPPAYKRALCWIWDSLARKATEQDNEFFVLLGDDIEVTGGWQQEVLNTFCEFSRTRPFGFGCTAIKDESFPVFPTFPVMHRTHFDIFGKLFHESFFNQHGDPYLFEIYRRFNVARFTTSSHLCNTVGGAGEARYRKDSGLVWRDRILTDGIEKAGDWLAGKMSTTSTSLQIPCIDIVVPTYRCDLSVLRTICDLSSSDASVHTIIVVDNPESDNLEELKQLERYDTNHTVRVYKMESNSGASKARNTGLAQSFGDHAILLDDDVIPEENLVDAYLGAIERNPRAKIYVGMTNLPPPETMVEKAMHASRICYFYGISAICKNPPWGVTANMCVKSRSNNSLWFSDAYPKTGGGEDVDYCLRVKSFDKDICSVSEAVVTHPFWKNPFKQVAGWATGDVMCLDHFPNKTFMALPNWCESTLFGVLLQSYLLLRRQTPLSYLLLALPMAINVVFRLPTYYAKSRHDECARISPCSRAKSLCIALMAIAFPSAQDAVRLYSKLRRLRLTNLCTHFDWMDNQRDHVAATLLASLFEFASLLCLIGFVFAEASALRFVLATIGTLLVAVWYPFQYKILSIQPKARPKLSELEFSGTKPTVPFVVLATQRTGSNMLCGYLGSHPQILMHNEIFNEVGIFSERQHESSSTTTTTTAITNTNSVDAIGNRDSDPTAFLQKAYEAADGSTEKAVGFKLFPEHITRSETNLKLFNSVLRDPRIRKIILVRENRLAVVMSVLRASISGQYTHKNHDEIPLDFKPSELNSFIESYDAYYEWLESRTRSTPVHRVSYEELADENTRDEALNSIAGFLEIDSCDSWKTPYDKQSSSFEESTENLVCYKRLQRAFKEHPMYEKWGFLFN